MEAQQVLTMGAEALFATAAVLALAAGRYAVAHDVRGVARDLSGRQRMEDIERSRSSSNVEAARPAQAWEAKPEPPTEVDEGVGVRMRAIPFVDASERAAAVAEALVTEMMDTGSVGAEEGATVVDGRGPNDVPTDLFTIEREVVLVGEGGRNTRGGRVR